MLALTAVLLPVEGYSTLCRDPISWAASAKRSPTAFIHGQEMTGERWWELLGKADCSNASEPLQLQITPAQTLKPEWTASHPFHMTQNASQRSQASFGSLLQKNGKVSAIEWEQEGAGLTPDSTSWAYAAKPTSQPEQLRCTITHRKKSLETRLLDTSSLLHTTSRI